MSGKTTAKRIVRWLFIAAVTGVLPVVNAATVMAGPREDAAHIAMLANYHGGLAIHFGHGDGQLTAALHQADNCVVQRLEHDADNNAVAADKVVAPPRRPRRPAKTKHRTNLVCHPSGIAWQPPTGGCTVPWATAASSAGEER